MIERTVYSSRVGSSRRMRDRPLICLRSAKAGRGAAKGRKNQRRSGTSPAGLVPPTGQKSKKYPQVEGLPVVLSKRHAKIRRDGYRRGGLR